MNPYLLTNMNRAAPIPTRVCVRRPGILLADLAFQSDGRRRHSQLAGLALPLAAESVRGGQYCRLGQDQIHAGLLPQRLTARENRAYTYRRTTDLRDRLPGAASR